MENSTNLQEKKKKFSRETALRFEEKSRRKKTKIAKQLRKHKFILLE
jgi:hypothetical protein